MANIDQYLEEIANARYGKEVRDAIYNAINELNNMIVSGDTLSSDDPAVNQVLSTINNRETPVREGRELLGSIEDDLIAIMQARYGRDVRQSIHDAIYDINEVAQGARNSAVTAAGEAQESANAAAGSATSAGTNATLSRSYAVGGTGTRTGEDTDNAKYYAESIHPGVANGVATLDANGRIPYSQLPESAMEYKGTWNANTNTPTLTQGVGTNGDFYIVDTAGTWDNVAFNVGDQIIFDKDKGTTGLWVKVSGGSVISVNGKVGTVVLNAPDIPFDPTGTTMVSTETASAIKEAYNHGGGGGGGVLPAPEFDTTVAYKVGDYVVYNGNTYRFTADKSAGAWDSTKVDQEYAMGARVTAGKKANTTLGNKATAEGYNTAADGFASHAEGYLTTANGFYSHAEGQNTTASANFSHAEGCSTKAQHLYSHAEGYDTQTGADNQHVQGKYNVGKSTTLFEIGNGTAVNARANAFEVGSDGVAVNGNGNPLRGMIEVTMAQYLANKSAYDASGDIIKVIDSGQTNTAGNTSFDDTTAQIGANNVQTAIEKVKSSLSAHTYGTSTSLYSGNDFTCTSDGTLFLVINHNKQLAVYINSIEAVNITNSSGSTMKQIVNVKKGMVISPYIPTDSGTVTFRPLE